MTEQIEGQMSIFDCFGPDIWSGRTSQEPSAVTRAKTSELSLKKRRGSSIRMPLYLDLRSGLLQDASWQTGGVLLGVYTMHSFGEYPKEERGSRLLQILEDRPHQKYCLSAKACSGILRRAEKRGKELPGLLKKTLQRQSIVTEQNTQSLSKREQGNQEEGKDFSYNMNAPEPLEQAISNQCSNFLKEQNECWSIDEKMGNTYCNKDMGNTLGARDYKQPQAVVYGISGYESNAMKSQNPHSGIYEADTTRTLDNNGGNPACNQGGMVVLEGNGSRPSHKGDGYKESDTMYTLNSTEHHAVCVQQAIGEYKIGGGGIQSETERLQGCNGFGDTVGALCAGDAKHIGNQYVNQGKCIIQHKR